MDILIGNNAPIRHKLYWQGNAVDADTLPTASFYDVTLDPEYAIDPNIVQSASTASKFETDIGVYEVFPPLNLVDRNKKLKVRWQYTVQGQSFTKDHYVDVITPYVDVTQAGEELGLGADPSDPNYKTYSQLMRAEQYARKTIENFTGQKFYLYPETITAYGSGSDVLPLPSKINKIYKIYQNDVLLVDTLNQTNNWLYQTVISDSGFGIRVDRTGMLDNTVYIANGMVPPSINDSYNGAFGKDLVYRINAQFGWDAVPNEIEEAAIELMKDYFSRDRIWRNKYIKSISTFDWDFEYTSEAHTTTGNLYVDNLLSDYVVSHMVVI